MKTKQIIKGFKNSQRIRVIVNGVGFHTTVQGMTNMVFTDQRVAVWNALEKISKEKDKVSGFAYRAPFYDNNGQKSIVDVQVDIV